jgi:hypothetical protein
MYSSTPGRVRTANHQCTLGVNGVHLIRGGSRIPRVALRRQFNRTGTASGSQIASLILTLVKLAGIYVVVASLTRITRPLRHRRTSTIVWSTRPILFENPPSCPQVKFSPKASFRRCHTGRHRVHWERCLGAPPAMSMKTCTLSRYADNHVVPFSVVLTPAVSYSFTESGLRRYTYALSNLSTVACTVCWIID